jgi:hypothetical protein
MLYSNPYNIPEDDYEELYNGWSKEEIEEKILSILRHIEPWKADVFKRYYGLDEYKGLGMNYTEISKSMMIKNKTINDRTLQRWTASVMEQIKKKLKDDGYIR